MIDGIKHRTSKVIVMCIEEGEIKEAMVFTEDGDIPGLDEYAEPHTIVSLEYDDIEEELIKINTEVPLSQPQPPIPERPATPIPETPATPIIPTIATKSTKNVKKTKRKRGTPSKKSKRKKKKKTSPVENDPRSPRKRPRTPPAVKKVEKHYSVVSSPDKCTTSNQQTKDTRLCKPAFKPCRQPMKVHLTQKN